MKVLALIEADNSVCSRYRLEAFAGHFADEGISLEVVPLRKDAWGRMQNLRAAAASDLVVVQRKLLPTWQTSLLRNWSKRFVYDVDDAVFQRDSNSEKGDESWSRMMRFRAIVNAADAVVVGNDYLREVAVRWKPRSSVHVVPTCIDTSKYQLARHHRVGLDARLIWIGQSSTLMTLEQAPDIFHAIAARMPGMEFWQVCNQSAEFAGLNVLLRPWSLENETDDLADGDIGVAWMPDDTWSLGKCGLKVLQYMAAGLPVVANPVGVHREMVRHGETGYLVETPEEWAEAVERLAADPVLRARMGAAARRTVEERYSVNAWGSSLACTIADMIRVDNRLLVRAA